MERQIRSLLAVEPLYVVEHPVVGRYFTSSLLIEEPCDDNGSIGSVTTTITLFVADSEGMIFVYKWRGGSMVFSGKYSFLSESILCLQKLKDFSALLIQYRNGSYLLCKLLHDSADLLSPLQWIYGNDCSFCSFALSDSGISGSSNSSNSSSNSGSSGSQTIALLNKEGNVDFYCGISDDSLLNPFLRLISTIQIDMDPNNSVMFLCFVDDATILIGFDDGSLKVYINFILVKEISVIKETLTACKVSERSIWIASSSNYIIYFDSLNSLLEGKPLPTSIELPNQGISSFGVGDDTFCSGGWDGLIRFFSVEDKEQLFVSNIHSSAIIELKTFGPMNVGVPDPRRLSLKHSEVLISSAKDGRLAIFSLRKNIKS